MTSPVVCPCPRGRRHRPTANPCGCDRCTECAATLAFEAKRAATIGPDGAGLHPGQRCTAPTGNRQPGPLG
jgi:hypothetical protein